MHRQLKSFGLIVTGLFLGLSAEQQLSASKRPRAERAERTAMAECALTCKHEPEGRIMGVTDFSTQLPADSPGKLPDFRCNTGGWFNWVSYTLFNTRVTGDYTTDRPAQLTAPFPQNYRGQEIHPISATCYGGLCIESCDNLERVIKEKCGDTLQLDYLKCSQKTRGFELPKKQIPAQAGDEELPDK